MKAEFGSGALPQPEGFGNRAFRSNSSRNRSFAPGFPLQSLARRGRASRARAAIPKGKDRAEYGDYLKRGTFTGAGVKTVFRSPADILNQYQIAELFDTDRTSILKNIRSIFETGELAEQATCSFFAQVRTEGKRTVTRRIAKETVKRVLVSLLNRRTL